MTSSFYISQGSSIQKAVADLQEGLSRHELWTSFALEDLRKRYIRSYAGMWWIFLSFGIFVVIKAIIFTPLSPESLAEFTPYVTLGFFVWVFMQTVMSEGSNVFIAAANWLKGTRISLSVFVFKSVLRSCVLTIFNFLVVVIVFAFTPVTISYMWLAIIPIIILFIINAIWVTYLFGVLGSRFRDFVHFTSTLLRMMIFLTPIFWKPEQMGSLWNYLQYNPFAHYIILFRQPILDNTMPWFSLWVVLACTFIGICLSAIAFVKARSKIPYWL